MKLHHKMPTESPEMKRHATSAQPESAFAENQKDTEADVKEMFKELNQDINEASDKGLLNKDLLSHPEGY